MNLREILGHPGREWRGSPPASEEELDLLKSRARAMLPSEYLDLLRFSNGGEGPLALSPLWFQLYSVDECIALCHSDGSTLEQFPTLMFFGGNGGLESIAFDLSVGPPWPIVTVDMIAGLDSVEQIAPNMAAFIDAIGDDTEPSEA
jgi:hypothetical protein